MLAILNCLEELKNILEDYKSTGEIKGFKIYLRLNFSIDVYIVTNDETKINDKLNNLTENNKITIKYFSEIESENDEYLKDLFTSGESVVYGSRYSLDSLLSKEKSILNNKCPIVTFYSYKGGMGRTTAMMFYAIDLALNGKKVFVVDCDLEAPGYLNFFNLSKHNTLKSGQKNGLIEFFCDLRFAKDDEKINVENYIINLKSGNDADSWFKEEYNTFLNNLFIMPAGNLNEGYYDTNNNRVAYLEGLSRINISDEIFTKQNFDKLFTKLNEDDGIRPDIILIDSRTGFNDIIGTSIQYFSDVIVGFFGTNEQSIPGLLQLLDTYENNGKQFKLVMVNSILPNKERQNGAMFDRFKDNIEKYLNAKNIYDDNTKDMPYYCPIYRIDGYEMIGVKEVDEPNYIKDIKCKSNKLKEYFDLFELINELVGKKFPKIYETNKILTNTAIGLSTAGLGLGLSAVAGIFSIPILTLIKDLKNKGIKIENNPNTIVKPEWIDILDEKYSKRNKNNINVANIDTWTLRNRILQNLKYTLADSQNMYAEDLEIDEKYFFYRECMYELFDKDKFIIRGYKGTGKTYLYKALSSNDKIAQNIRKKSKAKIAADVKIHYVDIISIGGGNKSFNFEGTFNDTFVDKIKGHNEFGFYGKIWQIHTWISILLDPLFEDIKINSKYSDKIEDMSGDDGILHFVEMIQEGLPFFVEIENDMKKINKRLVDDGMQLYILYDQLDSKIKPNHWGEAVSPLIDYWRERRNKYSNIYPKIFVRTDLYNRILGTNTILLEDNIINIEWSIEEIFSYFFKLVWSRDRDIFFEIMKRPGRIKGNDKVQGKYAKFIKMAQISEDNQIMSMDKSAIIPFVNVFFGEKVYSSDRYLGSPYEYFRANLANADNKSISLRPFITIFTFEDNKSSKNAIEKALAENIPNRYVTSIMSSDVYATRDIRISTANKYFDDLAHDKYSEDLKSVREFIRDSADGEKYRYKSLPADKYEEMLKDIIKTHKTKVVSNWEELSALLKANGIICEKPRSGQMWWAWASMYSYAWGLKTYEKQSNPKRLSAIVAIYNVAASTIVDYLASMGIEIENNPNTKVLPEWLALLDEKFKDSRVMNETAIKDTEKAKGNKELNISIEKQQVLEKLKAKEEVKTTLKPNETQPFESNIDTDEDGPKVLGTINLDEINQNTRPKRRRITRK